MPPFRNNSSYSNENTQNNGLFPVTSKSNNDESAMDPVMNFVIALFVISLILAGVSYYYNNKMSLELRNKEAQIEQIASEMKNIPVSDMKFFYDRYIATVQKEENKNMINSVFDYLSYVVVPGVRFTSFSFAADKDGNTAKVSVGGEASSLERTIKQMDSFKNSEYNKIILVDPISDPVKVGGVSKSESKYTFNVTFNVKTNVKVLVRNGQFIIDDAISQEEYDSLIGKKEEVVPVEQEAAVTDVVETSGVSDQQQQVDSANVVDTVNPQQP